MRSTRTRRSTWYPWRIQRRLRRSRTDRPSRARGARAGSVSMRRSCHPPSAPGDERREGPGTTGHRSNAERAVEGGDSGAWRGLLTVAVVDLHDAGGGAAVDPARLAGVERRKTILLAVDLEPQLSAGLDEPYAERLEIGCRHVPQRRLVGSR